MGRNHQRPRLDPSYDVTSPCDDGQAMAYAGEAVVVPATETADHRLCGLRHEHKANFLMERDMV